MECFNARTIVPGARRYRIGSQFSYSSPWEYLCGFLVFRLERMPNAFESNPRSRVSSFVRSFVRHENVEMRDRVALLMLSIVVRRVGNARYMCTSVTRQ